MDARCVVACKFSQAIGVGLRAFPWKASCSWGRGTLPSRVVGLRLIELPAGFFSCTAEAPKPCTVFHLRFRVL